MWVAEEITVLMQMHAECSFTMAVVFHGDVLVQALGVYNMLSRHSCHMSKLELRIATVR